MSITTTAKKSKLSMPASTTPPAKYDAQAVKQAANGRWADIIMRLANVAPEYLNGGHHPCPKCGGTDRFRFSDIGGDGSAICNQCSDGRNGDGFATLRWLLGCDFPTALATAGDYLGVAATESKGKVFSPLAGKNGKPAATNGKANSNTTAAAVDPAKDIIEMPWNEGGKLLLDLYCINHPPITPAAVFAADGRLVRYRKQFICIAIPIKNESYGIVGWVLMNITGGSLPSYSKQADGTVKAEYSRKPKLTYGSQPGLIGEVDSLADAQHVIKCEGITDTLATIARKLEAIAAGESYSDHAIVTNSNGCGQNLSDETIGMFAGKNVLIVGDCDKPGQNGAINQAGQVARAANECRNVILPFPITENHGKDNRDYLRDHSYADLLSLAEAAEIISPSEKKTAENGVNEADDDPHRLAGVILSRHAPKCGGMGLRVWRGEWYAYEATHYRPLPDSELSAIISREIKNELDFCKVGFQDQFIRSVS